MYLDEDLSTELVRGRELLRVAVHRLGEQQISKHLLEMRGHVPLLHHAAVVLNGQDDWVPEGSPQQPREENVTRHNWDVLEEAALALEINIPSSHSEVTKACSLMVWRTSRNLILEVKVWPW